MTRTHKWDGNFQVGLALRVRGLGIFLTLSALSVSCGEEEPPESAVSGLDGEDGQGTGAAPSGTGSTTSGDDEIVVVATGGAISDPAGSGGGPTVMIVTALPTGFTAADTHGGYSVVGPVDTVDVSASAECANVLRVIARDLPESHPDFQQDDVNGLYEGIVQATLGADKKPVLADPLDEDDLVESAESFNQWYHNVDGVNLPYVVDLWLEPVGGTFVFDSASFFPLDLVGYALVDGGQGQQEGFHFTTELHTSFQYRGGETFTFRGDDDVWVYINNQLAIDIGGVHGAEEASINLDAVAATFGLMVGQVYPLDLFQAERRTSESNFRIETTLDFTECGQILPVDTVVR